MLIERIAPKRLIRAWTTEAHLGAFLDSAQGSLRVMDHLELEDTDDQREDDTQVVRLSVASIEATSSPIVRLIDSTLYDALRLSASDIHFEVQNRSLQIKYRLDGVLQLTKQIDGLDIAHQAVSRIKVLADLDISERRVPQDGRFRAVLEEREVDFRVSIMPNLAGEDAVLRILDRRHLTGEFRALTLDSLKFSEEAKAFVRKASRLRAATTAATPAGSSSPLLPNSSSLQSPLPAPNPASPLSPSSPVSATPASPPSSAAPRPDNSANSGSGAGTGSVPISKPPVAHRVVGGSP